MKNENSAAKRFYWFKLKEDFFSALHILALRRLPSGDSICLIYLRFMLLSLSNDGEIVHSGIFPAIETELALALGEDETLIKKALSALQRFNLVEKTESGFRMTDFSKFVGSESASTKRMREHREKKISSEISPDLQNDDQQILSESAVLASHCDTDVTRESHNVTFSATEKEIEKESELRAESEKPARGRSGRFTRPSLDDVRAYCDERKNHVYPQKWLDHYTANGFMVGRSPMKDWRAAIRQWERNGYDKPQTFCPPPSLFQPESYVCGW